MNAAQLAVFYDQHLCRFWLDGTGDPTLSRGWLEQWWTSDCPKEPNAAPDGISILAAGGAGIRWRDNGKDVLGYVPGRKDGCYRIPRTATASLTRGARGWRTEKGPANVRRPLLV